jgi:hypothetical protein
MTVKTENMGTAGWRLFVDVLKAGAALDTGSNRPRGANGVNAYPQTAPDGGYGSRGSWLADTWADSVREAEWIIYLWSTPMAWVMGNGTWVVPSDSYASSQTTAAQNRIRKELTRAGITWADVPLAVFVDADH